MKRYSFLLLALLLFLLNLTALYDIVFGDEPDLLGEYLTLFSTTPIFGYLLGNFWLFLAKTFKKRVTRFTHFRGYHFHHSSLGVLMLITAFFINIDWLRIIVGGLGVGIFIHHIITDDLVFITKD